MQYMTDTGQYNPNKHTYGADYRTTTYILQLADILYNASGDKLIATAMSIDEFSVFDCVNYTTLLQKLDQYNTGISTRTWIHS